MILLTLSLRAAGQADSQDHQFHDRHRARRNSCLLNQLILYTSREALLLGYEEALTRRDSVTGGWYDCSAHMLWIGDRTRQPEGAHVELLRGVGNPISLKISPNHELDQIKQIIFRLNPNNEAGRLTLITRFGADKIENYLPSLVREIQRDGYRIVWSCDPMHGNTDPSEFGQKSRKFEEIPGQNPG